MQRLALPLRFRLRTSSALVLQAALWWLLAVSPATAASGWAAGPPWSVDGAPDPVGLVVEIAPEAPTGTSAPSSGDRSWPQTVLRTVVSPVFYDLDGDGTLDVIAADDQYARVYDHTGASRAGWPRNIGGSNMHAAVGDLDGDGEPEILIGSNFPTARLNAFEKNGDPIPGWPVDLPILTLSNVTCPVLIDLDQDLEMEVGVATEKGVSFLEADGTPVNGWPYLWSVSVNNPQWSGPAVGDIDGDGELEVAVGNACYPNWGVHVIRADGTVMPGWPKVIKPVLSSPALADLDADGDLEIIVQEGDPGSQGYRLWVWHHDGTTVSGWPRNIAAEGQSSRCSPAVADVDDNGVLEIITVTSDGMLHILEPDATYFPGYPRHMGGVQPIASPAVIDVDGDIEEEIFLTYWLANTQYVSGWKLDGSTLPGFPVVVMTATDMNAHSSVHVADLEGDGDLDLTVSAIGSGSGSIWVLPVPESTYSPGATREDWPKMRRDPENRGCFCDFDPAAVDPAAPVSGLLKVAPNPVPRNGVLLVEAPVPAPGRLAAYDASGRRLGGISSVVGRPFRIPVHELLGSPPVCGIFWLRWESIDQPGRAGARLVVISE